MLQGLVSDCKDCFRIRRIDLGLLKDRIGRIESRIAHKIGRGLLGLLGDSYGGSMIGRLESRVARRIGRGFAGLLEDL